MKAISNILFITASLAFMPVVNAACFEQAARKYQVDADLLRAIAQQESGMKVNALGQNKNREGKVVSTDLGLMQINTMHLARLAPYDITREKLLSDACVNIHVGALILAENIKRYGSTWEAVGAYNARSPDKRKQYAWKIYRRYHQETL